MSARPQRAVVLLHGLHDAQDDPFVDLITLESDLAANGSVALRFHWPDGFNAARTLIDPNRSFAALLAAELDRFLRGNVAGVFGDREWMVLAHSGGGLLWYRWLLDFAASFAQDYSSLPAVAVAIAAPYQCALQRIDLPNGRRLPVREPALEPRALVGALPGRLVVITAEDDATTLPNDTVFPPELVGPSGVTQYLVPGTGHRDVCVHALTRRLVAHHASQP